MSVINATVEQFKEHPALWGGGLLGIIVVGYLYTRKSGGGQVASFSYNVGPSDAQVQAGTAYQIATLNAQSNAVQQQNALTLGMADIASQTSLGTAYIGLLNTGMADQVTMNNANNSASLQALNSTNNTKLMLNNQTIQGANYQANVNQQTQLTHEANAIQLATLNDSAMLALNNKGW